MWLKHVRAVERLDVMVDQVDQAVGPKHGISRLVRGQKNNRRFPKRYLHLNTIEGTPIERFDNRFFLRIGIAVDHRGCFILDGSTSHGASHRSDCPFALVVHFYLVMCQHGQNNILMISGLFQVAA